MYWVSSYMIFHGSYFLKLGGSLKEIPLKINKLTNAEKLTVRPLSVFPLKLVLYQMA